MAGLKMSCVLTLMVCVCQSIAKPKPQFGFGIPQAIPAVPAYAPAYAPAAVAPIQPVAPGIVPIGLQLIPQGLGFGYGTGFGGAGFPQQGFTGNGFSRSFISKSSNADPTDDIREFEPSVNVRYTSETKKGPATKHQTYSAPSNAEYETYQYS